MHGLPRTLRRLVRLGAYGAVCCLITGFAAAFSLSGWEEGANAHRRVVANAVESEEPVVVYFQTDWCPWCRRLNDSYLRQDEVRHSLEQVRKIAVNPENGAEEKALLQRYGATGFPAFYVFVPAFEGRPRRLTPFRKDDADTPAQFAEKIREAIAHEYDAHGYDLSTRGQDKQAIAYFEKALGYDPDNAYACHSLAVTYQRLAAQTHDAGLLARAKEYYHRALAIDPTDGASQRALADLQ
jgi:thiol-disulfide isomerase/thioredoxin